MVKHFTQEVSRRHPILSNHLKCLLLKEEQQFYPELHLNDHSPHPVSEAEPDFPELILFSQHSCW